MVRVPKAALIVMALAAGFYSPEAPCAQALSPSKEARLDSICAAFKVAVCDSCTIGNGVKRRKHCLLAPHLETYARWLLANGKSYDACMRAIASRSLFMTSEKKNPFAVKDMPSIGGPNARVTIVVHVYDMCPQCQYLFTQLYREVTAGTLCGKAKVVAKPFANQVDSLETVRFSAFWNYIGDLADKDAAVENPQRIKIPGSSGNPMVGRNDLPYKTMARKTPVPFRTEGSSDVSAIPPIFIDGRLYSGDKDPRWIIDAALYEYEKTEAAQGR